MMQRDVFATGEYVEYFKPDQTYNPFHTLYAQKRDDVLDCLQRELPAGARVLDLGGGMGRMAVPLAHDHNVTLCDISPDMLDLAREAAKIERISPGQLSTVCVDAANPLPFATGSFDRALGIDLLVHLPAPVATLRELYRVLKPRGELMVDISNSSPWWTLQYPRYVGRRPSRWLRTWRGGGVLPEWQGIVRHYRRSEFDRMLATAGFESVEEWRYGPPWCPKWLLARCVKQTK